MRLSLEGRGFVVTGAAQGIGAAIVRGLSKAGARVAAIDIDAAGLAALDIAGVSPHAGDLGSRDSAAAVCADAARALGRVDGLVTSAGGVRGQVGRPLAEIDAEDWHTIFAANVDAAMWCAQALVPAMKQQSAGRIVTISSGAGLGPSLTGI